jgi:hypothetical protein
VLSVGRVRPGNRGLVLEASSRGSDVAGQFLFILQPRPNSTARAQQKTAHDSFRGGLLISESPLSVCVCACVIWISLFSVFWISFFCMLDFTFFCILDFTFFCISEFTFFCILDFTFSVFWISLFSVFWISLFRYRNNFGLAQVSLSPHQLTYQM